MKPDKYGLKFFVLADCNGYVLDAWCYRGAQSEFETDSSGIIERFCDFLSSDDVMFADNYYGSYNLAATLNEQGKVSAFFDFMPKFATHSLNYSFYQKYTFTVRENRPTWLFKNGLFSFLEKKDDSQFRYSPDGVILALSKWDKKKVSFLTNCFNSEISEPMVKGLKKKSKEMLVHMYNVGMGGVDLADAHLHQVPLFPHRRNKWTRCHFFTVLGFLIDNTWICWKALTRKQKGQKEAESITKRIFLDDLLQQICHEILGVDIGKNLVIKEKQHWPVHYEELNFTNQSKCKQCGGSCSYYCTACGISLHPKNCWQIYHSKKFKKFEKK